MEHEKAPLPIEAEEASAQLKYGQLLALVLGVVFLALMGYMAYVAATTPGFPYLFPALAMAFFAVGGVVDVSIAATSRSGALHLWHEGRFDESEKFLRGWRRLLGFVVGGILPGWFLQRAADRVQPLVTLERGGLPAGPATMGPGAGAYPAAGPGPGPAPSPYADSVAPDPFGGRRAVASPPPPPMGPSAPTPASLWSRPAGAFGAPGSSPTLGGGPGAPMTPKICPACQAPLDPDSRFCKKCGTPSPV